MKGSNIIESIKISLIAKNKYKEVLEIFSEKKASPWPTKKAKERQAKKNHKKKLVKMKSKNLCKRYI